MNARPNAAQWASERERLILEHLPQVRWIALRIHERLPNGVCLEDLISTGTLGLIAAVDRFDPSFNVKLATYATHKIRGAILDSVRELDGVPGHQRKKARTMEAAVVRLQNKLQRPPLEEEIAAELEISLNEYREWLQDVRGVALGSLDAVNDFEDARSCLLDYLADKEDNLPTVRLERAELERLVARGIEQLPENEKLVLDLYFHRELNLREIGEVMGVHLTRISQLKTQAILRLRAWLKQLWPTERGVL
ncbi:MAG: FliA/WhiG family RNA polymerase sigma factor [Acidobacteria bacterium]|nr:FliA/WhiG family RNA polymerase sigma factor [Acidobacteriota bacterium]